MNRLYKIALLGIFITTIASFGPPLSAAHAGACYDETAESFLDVPPASGGTWTVGHWTRYFEATTGVYCRDFNVQIARFEGDNAQLGHECSVWVDAQYYSPSRRQWIDGAHDDFWMLPGHWYTPITNLKDNVSVRVHFRPACADDVVTIILAA